MAAALLAVVVAAGPAAAHDSLTESVPAADSTLASTPAALTLTFSAAPRAVSVTVVGPDGAAVAVGGARSEGDRVRVRWPDEASAGRFLVSWRIVSSDGHPIRGSFAFSIGGRDRSAEAMSEAAAGAGPHSPGLTTGISIGIGVLSAAAAALAVRRRRRG